MTQTFDDLPHTDFDGTRSATGQVFFARTRPAIASLGRTWWVFVVQGIVTIALGLGAIIWPEAAMTVFTVFLGANLVLIGLIGIGMAFRIKRMGTMRPR